MILIVGLWILVLVVMDDFGYEFCGLWLWLWLW